MTDQTQEQYKLWLDASWLTPDDRQELVMIQDNPNEIEDRFYRDLEFGTAGMRGVLGVGRNRRNMYNVRRATQGLADCILQEGPDARRRGVVIAYDSRRLSDQFALETALTLAANGIHAYLYSSLRPVPQLSFAVRDLNAQAGVVITASHNPKQYNGYKVYWEDGAQMPPEPAARVFEGYASITDCGSIPHIDRKVALDQGLLTILEPDIDDRYMERVKSLSLNTPLLRQMADSFKVVYTPLHGSGNVPVRRVLHELGVKNVYVVPEQELPDPDFTTVRSPNPEEHDAFKMGIELARKVEADILFGTDPDCDRIGVLVRDPDGNYQVLTGNQMGCLLLHYILTQKKNAGTLPKNGIAIKTIVTTEMARAIASSFSVDMEDVLTGFKFIAERIDQYEKSGEKTFLFGFEESYGCLAGTFVRDKDAVIASMLAVEAACFYKSQGKTLYDAMQALYKQYGYYAEHVVSLTMEGKSGMEKIRSVMSSLRDQIPKKLDRFDVLAVRDYKASLRTNANGQTFPLTLPKSDVLYYELSDDAWLVVRPSGTEPKIKIYYAVRGKNPDDATAQLTALRGCFENSVKQD